MSTLAANVLLAPEIRSPEVVDEESRWVTQAVAGEAKAFERLYRRHVDRVYGLCFRLCAGDVPKAEQATQDAFVRAWERLSTFRGDSQFSTWIHRIAVNVVLGEHRLLKRWVTLSEDGETPLNDADTGFDRHDWVLTEDIGTRMDLAKGLARLPRGARAVLVLHDIEGYPHEEIAAMTGIAVGTSKAQLHRARKLLREWLQ